VRRDSGEIYAFGRNDKGQLGIETNGQALLSPKQITEFLAISVIHPSNINS
jgi:alpha-tubulin suppressor-like RCC1 family protein